MSACLHLASLGLPLTSAFSGLSALDSNTGDLLPLQTEELDSRFLPALVPSRHRFVASYPIPYSGLNSEPHSGAYIPGCQA